MYRNNKLLEIVRQAPCQRCGIEDGTVVAAHSNQLKDGKGRGIKAPDYRIAALCFRCHHEIDQGNKLTKIERLNEWDAAHRETIGWLFENDHLSVH
jgi:ribosomal protein S27AE